jgi:hypothetical protein
MRQPKTNFMDGAKYDRSKSNIQLSIRNTEGSLLFPLDWNRRQLRHIPDFEPLAGSNPTFELDSGWLSLFPTDGWARSLPTSWFSNQPRPSSMGEQPV